MKIRTLMPMLAIAGFLALPSVTHAQSSNSVRIPVISGYSVIDREHLVINGGASRHYLVTLRRSCWGLGSSTRIGTSFDAGERITMPSAEYILTQDGRCQIDTIEEVESLDAARALIEERNSSGEGDDGES